MNVASSSSGGAPRRVGPISAVVCNYNGAQYLRTCLDALLVCGDRLAEVLVVDNSSSDDSLALLAAEYPTVRVVCMQVNAGPGAARNAGMQAARERWVLAVDNDAELTPGCLERLIHALEMDPQAVLAQPRSVLAHEPERVHYDGAWFHYAGLFSLRNFYQPIGRAEGKGVLAVDGFVSICGLLDRDVVLDLGGYDESFFILFEDYDLSLRLRLVGHRILIDEDAIVLHRAGTAGISFRAADYPARRAYFHSRNRWLLLVKNHRWRTLLVSAPGILVYELFWLAFAASRGHFLVHLRGKAAFLRRLPAALHRRRMIQRRRTVRDRDLLVGGPLTLSPQLLAKPMARAAAGLLSRTLEGWWRLVRPLVP